MAGGAGSGRRRGRCWLGGGRDRQTLEFGVAEGFNGHYLWREDLGQRRTGGGGESAGGGGRRQPGRSHNNLPGERWGSHNNLPGGARLAHQRLAHRESVVGATETWMADGIVALH